MARPRKVKQAAAPVKEVEKQEVETSTEFDTEILNEAVQEKTPEKVTTKEVVTKPVPTAEARQAVHRVLEQKKVNVVPNANDQVHVLFKGVPRTWSSKTLDVMVKSYPDQVTIDGQPAKLDSNGKCCGR